jgi:hypothetical protein
MSSHLDFLQTLSERELCQLVLIPLLEELRYMEIRYSMDRVRVVKILIFWKYDPCISTYLDGWAMFRSSCGRQSP